MEDFREGVGIYQFKFQRQGAELKRVQGVRALLVIVTRHEVLDRGLFSKLNVQNILEEPLDLFLHGVNGAGDMRQVLSGQQISQPRVLRIYCLFKAPHPVQTELLEVDVGLRQPVQSGENDVRFPQILGLIEP